MGPSSFYRRSPHPFDRTAMTRSPLRRWHALATVGIVALSIVSSLLGLLRPGRYPPELLPQFYVQDLLLLAVGVPVLAVALRSAAAGSLRGRIV